MVHNHTGYVPLSGHHHYTGHEILEWKSLHWYTALKADRRWPQTSNGSPDPLTLFIDSLKSPHELAWKQRQQYRD